MLSADTAYLIVGMSDTVRPILLIGFIFLMFAIAGGALLLGKRAVERKQDKLLSEHTGTDKGATQGADQSFDDEWLAQARAEEDDDEGSPRQSWADAILGPGALHHEDYNEVEPVLPPEMQFHDESPHSDIVEEPVVATPFVEPDAPVFEKARPVVPAFKDAPQMAAGMPVDEVPAEPTFVAPVDPDEPQWDMGASDGGMDESTYMSFGDTDQEAVTFDDGPLLAEPEPEPVVPVFEQPEPTSAEPEAEPFEERLPKSEDEPEAEPSEASEEDEAVVETDDGNEVVPGKANENEPEAALDTKTEPVTETPPATLADLYPAPAMPAAWATPVPAPPAKPAEPFLVDDYLSDED